MSCLTPLTVTIASAIAMALAFPKANIAILAPLGSAGLFWTWYGLTPVRAFWAGWLAGLIFCAITWYWISESAGAFIAPFGFLLVLGPALVEGIAFGITGALSAVAFSCPRRQLAPLAAAAAFTWCEWLRSIGPLGVPFSDLSYTQVATPLAPIAAYLGSFGLTFIICALGAYLAYGLREARSPKTPQTLLIAIGSIGICTALAWLLWPARQLATPTYPVAAAQGNISQDIKWTQEAFTLSLERYEALTEQAATYAPAFVLWPETVMPVDLNEYPWLVRRLGHLARSTHTELIVGSKQTRQGGEYNALYFFRSDGTLDAVYRKRHLVPFAETLPAANILGNFPGAKFVSRFRSGNGAGVLDVDGAQVAPLICWESAFTDLTLEGLRSGGQTFVIATDDAWFRATAGPYQHAQVAQMRALESGAWIVRAGATGISGIIAPNGRYTVQTQLNTIALAHGAIGPRVETIFPKIGTFRIMIVLALLYLAIVAIPRPIPL